MFRFRKAAAPATIPSPSPIREEPKQVWLSLGNAQVITRPDIRNDKEGLALHIGFKTLSMMRANQQQASFVLRPPCSDTVIRIDLAVQNVLDYFGEDSLSKVNGRLVRILYEHSHDDAREIRVWAIGDYLSDRWLCLGGHSRSVDLSEESSNSYQLDGRLSFMETGVGRIFNRLPRIHINPFGSPCILKELYYCGYMNARLKLVTLVPDEGNGSAILVKLADICHNSAFKRTTDPSEITIRFTPKDMAAQTKLIEALKLVGKADFERLSGRLVRVFYPPYPDVTTSRIEADLQGRLIIGNPVTHDSFDIKNHAGIVVKETTVSEAKAA